MIVSVAIVMPCVGLAFLVEYYYGLQWVVLFCGCLGSLAHFVSIGFR